MTESDFHIRLAYLRERQPDNALLPLIERGYSVVNASYLDQAIEDLPPAPKTEHVDRTGDPVYDRLMRKRRDLYIRRAKLSNLFPETIHVSDRANISKRIEEVQAEIKRVQKTIHHYQIHGEEPLSVNPYDLPTDPILLRTKLTNAMSNRSRHRARERKLQEDPEANSAAIMAIQAKILDDEKLILHVREAIEAGL